MGFLRILLNNLSLEPICLTRPKSSMIAFVSGLGGIVTLNNIATDLQISPSTAKAWLKVIEKTYLAFAIYPYTKNVPRSILKPPKVFFYDNADVLGDEGARFENLIATTLLKRLNFMEDYYGDRASLHYLRDKESREVDFVTVINNQVIDLIEVKLSKSDLSSSLKYYSRKLKPKNTVQLVLNLQRSYHQDHIWVTTPQGKYYLNFW
jgi:predicted AAA+ superfamily ATPase